MRTIADIDREIDAVAAAGAAAAEAGRLLRLAEEVLEAWVAARGGVPTREVREGFRLLALHRQGAQELPSFNACRETCREIAYHYNLLALPAAEGEAERRAAMGNAAHVRVARDFRADEMVDAFARVTDAARDRSKWVT